MPVSSFTSWHTASSTVSLISMKPDTQLNMLEGKGAERASRQLCHEMKEQTHTHTHTRTHACTHTEHGRKFKKHLSTKKGDTLISHYDSVARLMTNTVVLYMKESWQTVRDHHPTPFSCPNKEKGFAKTGVNTHAVLSVSYRTFDLAACSPDSWASS